MKCAYYLLFILLSSQVSALVTYIDGEDYTLPQETQATPFSSQIAYTATYSDTYSQRVAYLAWKDFEPERGVYDWSTLELALTNANTNNQKVQLWIQSSVCGGTGSPDNNIVIPCAVPDWVFTEYGLDKDSLPSAGWLFDIRIIPQWRVPIRDDYNAMIRALGEQYGNDPRIGSVYVQGISSSRGEEYWLDVNALINLEQNWGYSASVADEWLRSRMDAFADAFASRPNIAAWVGSTEFWHYVPGEEYLPVAEGLLSYAWSKGFGNRGGALEKYYVGMLPIEEAFGITIDSQGYVYVDETLPPIMNNAYFGDENEEYNNESTSLWVSRFCGGIAENCLLTDPHRYRMSMMRALMNRFNHLWVSGGEYMHTLNPGLREYVRLSLGKNISTSPDAWALLFEHPVTDFFAHSQKIKNFELWLIQRDIPGGMTVPTERIDLPFDPGGGYNAPELHYDLAARRTDVASGNTSMYFDLDERFITENGVDLYIEIVDRAQTQWHVEYLSSEGVQSTEEISTLGDNKVRTYKIDFDDAEFTNGIQGMDFRIVVDGSEDIIVKWVRIVRWMGCSQMDNDLNGDCQVNFDDVKILMNSYSNLRNFVLLARVV